MSDTIFALASAQGRAGVAVVRISGPSARRAYELCHPQTVPKVRHAAVRQITLKHIKAAASDHIIDQALTLFFEQPQSFTGEDVVELHLHGGRAILKSVARALSDHLGFRPAEPGEFTRRAFANGKLDLTEAEGMIDLVNAETELQRRQAMRQFEGALGRLFEDWSFRLTRILAYLEASIDFSDEELPPQLAQQQKSAIENLKTEIDHCLDDQGRGERLRDGFEVVILGPPNAGKSSLLNKIAQRDAAIVSSVAGTTRDIVEVQIDLSGLPVTLADTAGLRQTADLIESEGVKRALDRAQRADLKLLMFDGEKWPLQDAATLALSSPDALILVNKSDLISDRSQKNVHFISTKTDEGIIPLLSEIDQRLRGKYADQMPPPLTRERHRTALSQCSAHLARAIDAELIDLCCEDIRLAVRALGRITGRVDVEDLLDVIFRDFCIGK